MNVAAWLHRQGETWSQATARMQGERPVAPGDYLAVLAGAAVAAALVIGAVVAAVAGDATIEEETTTVWRLSLAVGLVALLPALGLPGRHPIGLGATGAALTAPVLLPLTEPAATTWSWVPGLVVTVLLVESGRAPAGRHVAAGTAVVSGLLFHNMWLTTAALGAVALGHIVLTQGRASPWIRLPAWLVVAAGASLRGGLPWPVATGAVAMFVVTATAFWRGAWSVPAGFGWSMRQRRLASALAIAALLLAGLLNETTVLEALALAVIATGAAAALAPTLAHPASGHGWMLVPFVAVLLLIGNLEPTAWWPRIMTTTLAFAALEWLARVSRGAAPVTAAAAIAGAAGAGLALALPPGPTILLVPVALAAAASRWALWRRSGTGQGDSAGRQVPSRS